MFIFLRFGMVIAEHNVLKLNQRIISGDTMKQIFLRITSKLKRFQFQTLSLFMVFIVTNQTVIVQWHPNKESDLKGYNVHYGTTSRVYSYSSNVGLATSHNISNLQSGREYFFAVTAYDTAGNESRFSEEVSIYLSEDGEIINLQGSENIYNFPNPFNPEDEYTQIRYVLKKSESVTIVILNVMGQRVRTLIKDMSKTPGEHIDDVWDGRDENGNFVANGIYYAHLKSESLNHYITIAVTR